MLQAQDPRPAPAVERFARAAAFFERAAAIDPDFPQLQASLGVAYFNARMFDKATTPLSRAVAAKPADADLKRLLATSWLNTAAWEKAAALLEDDAQRRTDTALQFAYGLALLRSGRAAEAEPVAEGLLAGQPDSDELAVLASEATALASIRSRVKGSLERPMRAASVGAMNAGPSLRRCSRAETCPDAARRPHHLRAPRGAGKSTSSSP